MELTTAALIGSLAATGLSALGMMQSASTQGAMAEHNAAVSRINAGTAMNAGEADAARTERLTQRRLATAENIWGGSGLQMTGSVLDVMGDMAAEGALDAQIARWKAKGQSNAFMATGDQQTAQGRAASAAGMAGAATTILGGVSNEIGRAHV